MLKRKCLWDKFHGMALKAAAALALVVTTVNVNTCCWFILGQDSLPEDAKKLRRF